VFNITTESTSNNTTCVSHLTKRIEPAMAEFQIVQPIHNNVYPFISSTQGLQGAAKDRVVAVTRAGTGIGKISW